MYPPWILYFGLPIKTGREGVRGFVANTDPVHCLFVISIRERDITKAADKIDGFGARNGT